MICNKCGNQIPTGQSFCNICGTPVTPNQSGGSNNVVKIVVIGVLVLVVIVLGVIAILPSGKKELKDDTTTTTNVNSKALNEQTTTTTTESTTKPVNNSGSTTEIDVNNLKVLPEDDAAQTKKIEFISAVYNKDLKTDQLQLVFKNNNDYLASGSIYLNYYQNGTRIGSSTDLFSMVNPGSRFVVKLSHKISEPFDSIDVTYKAYRKTASYVQVPLNASDVKIKEERAYPTQNNIPTELECTFTHTLDKKATYYLGIIYKKDGKDVGYERSINQKSPEKRGDIGTIKFYPAINGPKDFDDYEVFVQSAYTQDENL